MALPSGVLQKIVLGGPVTASDDWSIGIWYRLSALPSQTNLDQATSDAQSAFNASVWDTPSLPWKAINNTATKFAFVKSYVYSDGALTMQSESTATPVAGTSTLTTPPYVALVATLLTDNFGRSYRGRVYMPATGVPMVASSGLMSGLAQGYADELADWVGNVLGAGAPYAGTPSVVSQTKSLATPIVRLRVDNKPDTQRGRQSKDAASSSFTADVTP